MTRPRSSRLASWIALGSLPCFFALGCGDDENVTAPAAPPVEEPADEPAEPTVTIAPIAEVEALVNAIVLIDVTVERSHREGPVQLAPAADSEITFEPVEIPA